METKETDETKRELVKSVLPAVIFTVYGRSVMAAQNPVGSPVGSMAPGSSNPSRNQELF